MKEDRVRKMWMCLSKDVGMSREREKKNKTSLSMCEREGDRLRQRDKTGELMRGWGRVNVWGGETEGGRGGNEGKEKVSVWIVSSEDFMSGLKSPL